MNKENHKELSVIGRILVKMPKPLRMIFMIIYLSFVIILTLIWRTALLLWEMIGDCKYEIKSAWEL